MNWKIKIALVAWVAAGPASAANVYGFGDSLTDCCLGYGGEPKWLPSFAAAAGLYTEVSPNYNFAIAGAQTGQVAVAQEYGETVLGLPENSGLLGQVDRVVGSGHLFNDDDVAAIWIGTNDIWPTTFAYSTEAGGPGIQLHQPLGPQPSVEALVAHMFGNVETALRSFQALGLTQAVLLSTYDLAESSFVPDSGKSLARAYSEAWRDALLTLDVMDLDIFHFDTAAYLAKVQADPSGYGYDHVTSSDSCEILNCTTQSQDAQDRIVFADGIHFMPGFYEDLGAEVGRAWLADGGNVPPVPLPAGAILLMGGLGALAALRRRAASMPR